MISRALHAAGVVNGPIQRLHAADGAAQNQPQPANAQRVQQPGLRTDVVADRNQRKVRAVDVACFRVHRPRARRAVAGAQHVDADHKVVIQRQNRAGGKDLRPPGTHQRRAGKRMADQHGVVPGRVQPAIHRVVQRYAGQRAAALQQQVLVEHKVAFVGGRRNACCCRHRFRSRLVVRS